MTAPLRSRSFVAIALAASLVPVPGLAAASSAARATEPAPVEEGATPEDTNDISAEAPEEGTEETQAEGDEVPTEVAQPEPEEEAATEEAPAEETPPVPEGPERPPEPTLGNGKYKAKGTGLMIAGGVLLGLGVAGVITTYFLTRCPDEELDKSFACRNRQHNTFAVPATGAAAVLGAVLLAVGVTYRVRYKRWENWDPKGAKTAIRPAFSAGGIGFRF